MKHQVFKKASVVLSLALILCNSAFAQKQEKSVDKSQKSANVYVISANAGGINFVSGIVRVKRYDRKTTQILTKSDQLNDGDAVTTGENGKVEVLLNPGSFLRLAESSNIEFTNTALDSLRIKLNKGSALLEASVVGDEGADIVIATPHANVRLEKAGIYRLNTDQSATEVFVWKGAASVGNNVIKGKHKAIYRNGVLPEVAKFEKDSSRDAFDVWSKDRAKELAKLNERLERRALARAFNGFSRDGFNDRFGSGYWAFDRVTSSFCFVPSGWNSWGSPYGFAYNRSILWNRWNNPIVTRPQPPQTFQNPNISSGPTAGGLPQGQSPSMPPSAAAPPRPSASDAGPRMPRSAIGSKGGRIIPD